MVGENMEEKKFYPIIAINSIGTNEATCTSIRPSGTRPKPPRCAVSGVAVSGNYLGGSGRAFIFGGVHDVETDDGESVSGYFHNDAFALDLNKAKWFPFNYTAERMPCTRIDSASGGTNDDVTGETAESDVKSPASTTVDNFTLTVSADKPSTLCGASELSGVSPSMPLIPSPRSSCGLAVLGSTIYLYGGIYEAGERKFTLDDMYSLSLSKPVGWACLYEGSQNNQPWHDSETDEDDEDSNEERRDCDVSAGISTMDIDDESSSSDDSDDILVDAPQRQAGELFKTYWQRTNNFWVNTVTKSLSSDQGQSSLPDPANVKLAEKLASDFFHDTS